MDAEEAFQYLLGTAKDEIATLVQRGVEYSRQGDTGRVRETAEQVTRMKNLVQILDQACAQWQALLPPGPLFASRATTQSSVVDDSRRTPPGQRTPEEKLWLPILQALIEMDGVGTRSAITDRVGEIMRDVMNEVDRQHLSSDRSAVRWRNTTAFARNELKEAGYISSSSPAGIWEITPTGRAYFANRTKDRQS